MKKTFLFLLFLSVFSVPLTSFSQYKNEFGGGVGVSNYLGDMGGKANTRRDFVSDLKMSQTRWDFSLYYQRKVSHIFYLKSILSVLRLQGDDALCTNPGRRFRNLSFKNDIVELDVTGDIVFYENTDLGSSYRSRNAFRAVGFVGIGLFSSNPKTLYNGQWIALRPLMTEGQSKPYKRINVAIPIGIGFHYTVKKRHRITWELNWRTTFTDYIDDVSGNYALNSDLKSPEAVILANRVNVAEANAFQPGLANNFGSYIDNNGTHINKRGQSNHNDSYLSTSVTYGYVLRGKSKFYKSKYGSFFRKKRKVVRRIRSKF